MFLCAFLPLVTRFRLWDDESFDAWMNPRIVEILRNVQMLVYSRTVTGRFEPLLVDACRKIKHFAPEFNYLL